MRLIAHNLYRHHFGEVEYICDKPWRVVGVLIVTLVVQGGSKVYRL